MAFALTLLYIALTVLSPADLFPALAPYRIMVWLALLAIFASVPAMLRAEWRRFPHFSLLAGVILAICLSHALNGWFGGVPIALAQFLPTAAIFFLVVLNVTRISQLRMLSWTLILIALCSVVQGIVAYHTDNHQSAFVEYQPVWIDYSRGLRTGFLRIRALGFLNDPNDFAQFLLMVAPLLLPAWSTGRFIRNLFVIILPAAVLLYGFYLTNSRGALLGGALMVTCLVKHRLGAKRSAILTPFIVAGMLMLNQSGRSMSLQDDSALGRVNAWSDGLGMFQSSPLWGIGYGQFTEHHERTAHNSFVLCLAELGLIGSFLWVGLIVACVFYLQSSSKRHESGSPEGRWAIALRSSLYPVLATSWFLSRTYSPPLYLILGMSVAFSSLSAATEENDRPRFHWATVTIAMIPVLMMAVYGTVRMR